jgi:hypothetical protein
MELKNVKRERISAYVKKYPKAEFHANKNPWSVNVTLLFHVQLKMNLKLMTQSAYKEWM